MVDRSAVSDSVAVSRTTSRLIPRPAVAGAMATAPSGAKIGAVMFRLSVRRMTLPPFTWCVMASNPSASLSDTMPPPASMDP